ncbi:MAG: branched-chain amino acid ABC transporter permease, partial [Anaerolineae bacterium]|nr:branched-chain amino acid ABC transporter permease [Anaerolineae bacterium]
VLGFVIGLVSLRLRGVYFAIFTLAVAEMFAIYVGRWPLTNAEDGFVLTNLPAFLNPARDRLTYYYFVMILMAFTFLFIRRLINSPTGSVLLAIRENENRAQAIGYNTLIFKLVAITLAGMIAAGAGMLQVILTKKVGPEILTVSYTVDPLLMTIIGGIGTFSGPVIGASILHLSERILNREFVIGSLTLNIGQSWSLILGIAFILVVMVFPQGIVGTWTKWRLTRQARKVAAETPS